MRDLNIDFLEEYKSVDKFIKDAYESAEGVTEYIRSMEESYNEGSNSLDSKKWDDDFRRLKIIRHIRNQLAHEASIDSDVCDEFDYDWLCDFRKRLLSGDDPLALLRKAKSSRQKASQNQVSQEQHASANSKKNYHIHFQYDPPVPEEKENKVPGIVWIILIIVIIGILKILGLLPFWK